MVEFDEPFEFDMQVGEDKRTVFIFLPGQWGVGNIEPNTVDLGEEKGVMATKITVQRLDGE